MLTADEIQAACDQVPEKLKRDIQFAHGNVKRFAEAQKSTIVDTEVEVIPGLIAGQKAIPCNAAGCYAPGGRYAHIASALMTVTTAKVAGCQNIVACSYRVQGSASTQQLFIPLTFVVRIILWPLVGYKALRQ